MTRKKRHASKKIIGAMVALQLYALVLPYFSISAAAAGYTDYKAGTHDVTASLSCYVPAMGGVEFGAPLLTRATVTVDEDKSAFMTLYFTKSSVTIYSITCDTFIDPSPSSPNNSRGIMSGTIGYYDANGTLQTDGVSYSLGSDTALNSAGEAVNYVTSVTFPLDRNDETYYLTMYINSNVMGVQFCNSNAAATETTYPAILSVQWPQAHDSTAAGAAGAAEVTQAPGDTQSDMDNQLAPDTVEPAGNNDLSATENYLDGAVSTDGMNVYYAEDELVVSGNEMPLGDYDAAGAAPSATLNMLIVKILAVCAAVLIVMGAALIFSAKFSITRRG